MNASDHFIAQVCHIEAAEPGGRRFRAEQADEERRSPANLVLMCYRHHVETDDVDAFSVERLLSIKAERERHFSEDAFRIEASLAEQLAADLDIFWQRIVDAHKQHVETDMLALEVDFAADFPALINEIEKCFSDLRRYNEHLLASDDQLPEQIRELVERHGARLECGDEGKDEATLIGLRNWEWHVILFGNTMKRIEIALYLIRARHLETLLRIDPQDTLSKKALSEVQSNIKECAHSIAID